MNDSEKIQILENQIKSLDQKYKDLAKEFEEYVDEKRKEESQRLKTALMAAGGVILALGTFIWADIIWPVIKAGRP